MKESLRQQLLSLARESIQQGLLTGRPAEPDPQAYAPELREPGASFVTLKLRGDLRGCIGTLEPEHPLLIDVAHNAQRAAFRDPRFPPLSPDEFRGIEIQIAVLNQPEPLPVESESQLIEQLRPGVDGLTLRDGERGATFLPAVWEQLPEPEIFVRHLKRKAGWPGDDYWSPKITAERYTVESFSE